MTKGPAHKCSYPSTVFFFCFLLFFRNETYFFIVLQQIKPITKEPFARFSHFSSFCVRRTQKMLSKEAFHLVPEHSLISEIVQLIGEVSKRTFFIFHHHIKGGKSGKLFSFSFFHKIKHFQALFRKLFFLLLSFPFFFLLFDL